VVHQASAVLAAAASVAAAQEENGRTDIKKALSGFFYVCSITNLQL
jgi:hypothetical protein